MPILDVSLTDILIWAKPFSLCLRWNPAFLWWTSRIFPTKNKCQGCVRPCYWPASPPSQDCLFIYISNPDLNTPRFATRRNLFISYHSRQGRCIREWTLAYYDLLISTIRIFRSSTYIPIQKTQLKTWVAWNFHQYSRFVITFRSYII